MTFRNAFWAGIPLALCLTGCQDRNAADIPEVIHDWPQTERLPNGNLNYVGMNPRPRFTRKGEGVFSTSDGDIVLRIGSPNTYVYGRVDYVISYTIGRAMVQAGEVIASLPSLTGDPHNRFATSSWRL